MKYFIVNCLLVFVFCVSPIAHGAVRTVGNGGGFAELKAYVLLNKIPFLINYCLLPQNKCAWSNEAIDQVVQLNKKIDLQKLDLVAPFSGTSTYDVAENKLFLNSTDLYQSDIPLPLNKIMDLMLRTLIRGTFHIEPAYFFSMAFLDSFEENIVSINDPQMQKTLHFLSSQTINSEANKIHFLALESEQKSIDLTNLLFTKMNCPEPTWQILNWNFDSTTNLIQLELGWACAVAKYSADLQIRLTDQEPGYKLQLLRKIKIN